MNPIITDPDIKINMSLDEIIHLSRDQIESQLMWKNNKNGRKKKKKRKSPESSEHSVPLLSSPFGVGINVSKKSSLLSAEHRRRIKEAFSNRAINSDLIEKSKKIIPAEYQLVRTEEGVERVLVPAKQYFTKPVEKILLPPRKLNQQVSTSNSSRSGSFLPDKPPPLINTPIYSPPPPQLESMKMDVDEENEIAILESPQTRKQCEVIDVESNSFLGLVQGQKLSVPGPSLMPDGSVKTLSERFTMLSGSFRF